MRARYVIRITPTDVGQRVSVRSWLPDAAEREAGPAHTDTVGTLESWQDGVLAIRRRTGTLTEIDEASMVAGKVIAVTRSRLRRDVPPAP